MQLRDIQCVLAIAETRSFSKAAAKLYVSQPALSQLVSRLEEELGVRLFTRENNAVTLTYAGEIFLKDGRTILELSDQIRRKMHDLQELKNGVLVVAISPFYQRIYLTKALPVFSKRYPGIRITVQEEFSGDREQMLLNGKCDLSIGAKPASLASVCWEHVFTESILLCVPQDHPLNASMQKEQTGGLSIEQLRLFADENFVMYKPNRHMRDISLAICREAGFEPKIVFETHSCESINAVVSQGMGLGFVPMATQESFPVSQRPVCYEILHPRASRDIGVAYQEKYLSSAAREFIRIFHETTGAFLEEFHKHSPIRLIRTRHSDPASGAGC